MIAPCKDCPDSVIGCHAECVKYREFNAWAEEKRRERRNRCGTHVGFERKIRRWMRNKKG